MSPTNASEKGQSKRTKQRDARIATVGRPVVLKGDRTAQAKYTRTDGARRSKHQKEGRDKGRPRSGQTRNVSPTRDRMPYPEEVVMLFENAIVKFFKKYPAKSITGLRSTNWTNLRTLFGLILERKWSQLPQEVQDDGRTSDGKVKWRSSQIKIIGLNRYLEADSNNENMWILKDEFHPLVSGDNADVDSYGIGQNAVFEEIVEELVEELVNPPAE